MSNYIRYYALMTKEAALYSIGDPGIGNLFTANLLKNAKIYCDAVLSWRMVVNVLGIILNIKDNLFSVRTRYHTAYNPKPILRQEQMRFPEPPFSCWWPLLPGGAWTCDPETDLRAPRDWLAVPPPSLSALRTNPRASKCHESEHLPLRGGRYCPSRPRTFLLHSNSDICSLLSTLEASFKVSWFSLTTPSNLDVSNLLLPP